MCLTSEIQTPITPLFMKENIKCGYSFLARLHEVHRAIVVTSGVSVYVYVYVYVYVRVTLSVKVFYKSISLDHVDGSS